MVIHLFPGWVNAGENGGSKLVKKLLFRGSMLVVIYIEKYFLRHIIPGLNFLVLLVLIPLLKFNPGLVSNMADSRLLRLAAAGTGYELAHG